MSRAGSRADHNSVQLYSGFFHNNNNKKGGGEGEGKKKFQG